MKYLKLYEYYNEHDISYYKDFIEDLLEIMVLKDNIVIIKKPTIYTDRSYYKCHYRHTSYTLRSLGYEYDRELVEPINKKIASSLTFTIGILDSDAYLNKLDRIKDVNNDIKKIIEKRIPNFKYNIYSRSAYLGDIDTRYSNCIHYIDYLIF